MSWYYLSSKSPLGPFDDSYFRELISINRVQPNTLVWKEGMENWTSLEDSGFVSSISHIATDHASCSSCHQSFHQTEMIQQGKSYLCPNCTPLDVIEIRNILQNNSPQKNRFKAIWKVALGVLGIFSLFAAYFYLLPLIPTRRGGVIITYIISIPVLIGVVGVIELVTGKPFIVFAKRWDMLPGWARLTISFFLFLIALLFVIYSGLFLVGAFSE